MKKGYWIIVILILLALSIGYLYIKSTEKTKEEKRIEDKQRLDQEIRKKRDAKIEEKIQELTPEQKAKRIKMQKKWSFIPEFSDEIQNDSGKTFLEMVSLLPRAKKENIFDGFYDRLEQVIPIIEEEYWIEDNRDNKKSLLVTLAALRSSLADNFLKEVYQNEQSWILRSQAIHSLGLIASPENKEFLLSIAKNKDEDVNVRNSAIYSLNRKHYFEKDVLLDLLNENNPRINLTVSSVFLKLRMDEGIILLRDYLNNNPKDYGRNTLVRMIGEYHRNEDLQILNSLQQQIEEKFPNTRTNIKSDIENAKDTIILFQKNQEEIVSELKEYLKSPFSNKMHFAMNELSRIKTKDNEKFLNKYINEIRPGNQLKFIEYLMDNDWQVIKENKKYKIRI